eukprot:NODE_1091_length_2609_cov_8.138598.p1 GENE.NODE_1091_length_2609_cov_8.138598~~NODE_1091_length_2609_cov_8.138598.p1  ORF type:complete len:516 (+),score=135.81 NODE_1091_length_2609_cov_8.138598:280-1827(+)
MCVMLLGLWPRHFAALATLALAATRGGIVRAEPAQNSDAEKFRRLANWVHDGSSGAHPLDSMTQGMGPYGRTVIATRDIAVGEAIMNISKMRLMGEHYWKEHEDSELVTRFIDELGEEGLFLTYVHPQTWLALYIMEQRRLGSASHWFYYLDILPDSYPDLPIFWGEAQEEWLRGSHFFTRAMKMREGMDQQFQMLTGYLGKDFTANYTIDDYYWARSAISTRVFGWVTMDGESLEFMVPFGDMLDHRSPKQVEWFYNETDNALVFTALEAVPKGAVVLTSYGAQCNSKYLLHYGFSVPGVLDRKPAIASVRLRIGVLEDATDREEKLQLVMNSLSSSDDDSGFSLFSVTMSLARLDASDMLGYLRLLSARWSSVHQGLKSQTCRKYTSPPRCDRPFSLQSEATALQWLLRIVIDAEHAYPTTLEEDNELLASGSLEAWQQHIVLLRRDEKGVLRWWQNYVRDMVLPVFNMTSESELDAHVESFPKEWHYTPEAKYVAVTLGGLLAAQATDDTEL